MRLIAKIRRPHGVKGACVVELLYSDSADILKTGPVFLEDEELKIKEIFGFSGNICRVFLEDVVTPEQAREFSGKYIAAEGVSTDLTGWKIMHNNAIFATITGVHDFGAGVMVDTNRSKFPQMILLDDLELDYEKQIAHLKMEIL